MSDSRLRLLLLSADPTDFEALARTWADASAAPLELEWCTDVGTALARLAQPAEHAPLFVVGEERIPDASELERWRRDTLEREGHLALLRHECEDGPGAPAPPDEAGVWRWDLESNAFDLDPSWREWLQLIPSAGTVSVRDFLARVHPEDAEGLREKVTDLLSMDAGDFRGRVRMSPGSGPWWAVELRVGVVADEAGRVQALGGEVQTLDPSQVPTAWERVRDGAAPDRFRELATRLREMVACVLENEARLGPAGRRMLEDALQLAEALSVLHAGSSDSEDEIRPQV